MTAPAATSLNRPGSPAGTHAAPSTVRVGSSIAASLVSLVRYVSPICHKAVKPIGDTMPWWSHERPCGAGCVAVEGASCGVGESVIADLSLPTPLASLANACSEGTGRRAVGSVAAIYHDRPPFHRGPRAVNYSQYPVVANRLRALPNRSFLRALSKSSLLVLFRMRQGSKGTLSKSSLLFLFRGRKRRRHGQGSKRTGCVPSRARRP